MTDAECEQAVIKRIGAWLSEPRSILLVTGYYDYAGDGSFIVEQVIADKMSIQALREKRSGK
jgi:hypothetical protein